MDNLPANDNFDLMIDVMLGGVLLVFDVTKHIMPYFGYWDYLMIPAENDNHGTR